MYGSLKDMVLPHQLILFIWICLSFSEFDKTALFIIFHIGSLELGNFQGIWMNRDKWFWRESQFNYHGMWETIFNCQLIISRWSRGNDRQAAQQCVAILESHGIDIFLAVLVAEFTDMFWVETNPVWIQVLKENSRVSACNLPWILRLLTGSKRL